MVKLSVIIVNYNVQHFLEQCLSSVERAVDGIDSEVFVVDNNSIDGSVAMVRDRFPWVKLIENRENTGFSKANNQAIRESNGEYVLLLNPDTIVKEDTFKRCIDFMDDHPDAGGLGVKMMDGKGRFLPESKRGLPTPEVAFYKIFGLSALFPKSRRFGKYHLGFLDKNETFEIQILSGAFMWMRKEALDKVGLLDEDFFMYGEDIDLSWRIIKGGYKNYYFPETSIIHYKGESTKKTSVNYVFVFYRAMVIFARKHFSQKNASLFSFLINSAIYFRASIALAARLVRRSFMYALDVSVILILLIVITRLYEDQAGKDFPEDLLRIALPLYALTWVTSQYYSGGYDRPVRWFKLLKGVGIGTVLLLMVYALLDKSVQFSRVIILFGAASAAVWYLISRLIVSYTRFRHLGLRNYQNERFAIVGSRQEAERVSQVLRQAVSDSGNLFFVAPAATDDPFFAGSFNQLDQIADIHKIDEIIFCSQDIPNSDIISSMSEMKRQRIDFKIAQPETTYLIGSNSINRSGDLYVVDVNNINRPSNRRNKRSVDLATCFLFLPLLILSPLIVKNPMGFYRNYFSVLFGLKTWVGYGSDKSDQHSLPKLRPGVLTTAWSQGREAIDLPPDIRLKLDQIYARDYRPSSDMRVLFENIRHTGRS